VSLVFIVDLIHSVAIKLSVVRSILSPPTFLMILVIGETDVTTFSFSALDVIVVLLVLFVFILEARDSEIDVAE
jgi:hypothetical protein